MEYQDKTIRTGATLYSEVTDRIIAQLEDGTLPWVRPWDNGKAALGLPRNGGTGRRYSGINVLILWHRLFEQGYGSQRWLTYRQAQALGGNVRKGEQGTTVCYADRFTPKDGDTVNVGNALDPQYGDIYTRNAGNASALMALRDVKMFDESSLADGYAGLMAQVGTRTQSAQYAAKLSGSIASNLEASRTAVSGVNLDEEAARLIQYQQAYQASAKMLQIAQNIFDNLIQTMGR